MRILIKNRDLLFDNQFGFHSSLLSRPFEFWLILRKSIAIVAIQFQLSQFNSVAKPWCLAANTAPEFKPLASLSTVHEAALSVSAYEIDLLF